MGAGEGELVELFEGQPPAGDFSGRVAKFCAPGLECDSVAGDGMFDGAEGFGGSGAEDGVSGRFGARHSGPQRFRRFLGSGILEARLIADPLRPEVPRAGFEVRKFPEVCVHDAVGSLADEESACALNNEGEEVAIGGSGAFAEVGELAL